MKRIPFTIEDWKAGGVPVTRSGEYVKQLTYFEGVGIVYPFAGLLEKFIERWTDEGDFINSASSKSSKDLFLEVPCTKYYTHYYRDAQNDIYTIYTVVSKCPEPGFDNCIKTVEVEL